MKGPVKSKESNAENDLKAEDYKCLFESTLNAMVVFDPEVDNFILCNAAACNLFGYGRKEDFKYSSLADISPEYQPDGKLSASEVKKIVDRILNGESLEGRWLFKRKGGDEFFARVNLMLVHLLNKPLIFADIKDETEEAHIEAELRDNMNSLDVAVNGTGVGLWDWDIENGNLILNDNWFDMLGFTRKDFEKRYKKFGFNTFADSVHPDDMIKVEEKLKSHYAGEIDFYRVEIRMRTANNDWKWILAAGKVSEWKDDKPRRMVGIHTDIDYRVRMEDKLKEAIYKAEESDRLKTAFLANMSHEIRTPMNGIIGFMDLMISPESTEKQRKEYSEIIKNNSRQLLDIVNDIMDMSKIEAGQVEIIESVVNIKGLLKRVNTQFSNALHKGVKMILNTDVKGIGENIMSDQAKLYQVFSNLISNASKFTQEGEISIGYSLEGEMLKFYVKDTGEGIGKEHHKAIFERFNQIDLQLSRPKGGTGLGLSICKAYIEKMGGNIWFESTKGKGSIFYFTVPYKPVDYIKSKVIDLAPDSTGKKQDGIVLVVEDELYNYLFAEYVLKVRGYSVIHSDTGSKAIEYIRLYPEISMVIMDIRLPDITGYEATKEIKMIRPELPVVALTALALSGDRESALEAGCDDYLKKPITKEKLIESVSFYLG